MAKFDHSDLKKIAVITSGGDAPGMNAAIRAIVRCGCSSGLEVFGYQQGYEGIVNNKFEKLNSRSVANIIQRGGTILKSGRYLEFHKTEIRKIAIDNLKSKGVDALIVIGGNGSLTAAHLLWEEHKFPTLGIPATIDNDLTGSDATIGFDTAVNTALEAIDRIRDTAASHDRLFIVEVMGKENGFIALDVGLAGGAEGIFVPEYPAKIDEIILKIQSGMQNGKLSSILITAEWQKPGRAYDLAESIRKKSGMEAKVCILGHIQRGGRPSAKDRILASQLGAASINTLLLGNCDVLVGVHMGRAQFTDLTSCLSQPRPLNKELLDLCDILSR